MYSVTLVGTANYRRRSAVASATGTSNTIENCIMIARRQLINILYANLNVQRGGRVSNLIIKIFNQELIPTIPKIITSGNVDKVISYLNINNLASGAPFSAYVFGNAFTNEEVFMGAGIGQKYNPSGQLVNTPVSSDMCFRWASMTKLLGMILFCKAIEDGLITSIDDPVWLYVPEVANISTYISGSTAQLDGLGQPILDEYGTPLYTPIITTVPNLGKSMTIRHLLNYSSGLGYTFYSLGYTRQVYVNNQSYTDFTTNITYNPPYNVASNLPPNNSPFTNYIAYLQYMENIAQTSQVPSSLNVDVFTSYYYNEPVTFTDTILARINFPLLNIPGAANENNYGADLNMLGAVIGGALQLSGNNITSAQYCQQKILIPLNMNNTWLSCGSLQPPSNASSKMLDACFYRYTDVQAGYTPGNQFNAQTSPAVSASYNVVSVSSDPAVQNDGFTRQENGQVYKSFSGYPTDKYAGGYAESGIGPLTDYSKLIQLIINKGVVYNMVNGIKTPTTILNTQSIEYLLCPKVNTAANNPNNGIWACGTGTTSFAEPQESFASGFAVTDRYKGQHLPIGIGPNTYRWQAYYGHHYYFDTSTGNYLIGGCESSFAAWPSYTAQNTSYEPEYKYIWQIMTLQNN
jgi:CubicO group peptidase (beta-lactamase class C family)